MLRIAGLAMTPRIILMTDGKPNDSAGDEEVHKDSLCRGIMLLAMQTYNIPNGGGYYI